MCSEIDSESKKYELLKFSISFAILPLRWPEMCPPFSDVQMVVSRPETHKEECQRTNYQPIMKIHLTPFLND